MVPLRAFGVHARASAIERRPGLLRAQERGEIAYTGACGNGSGARAARPVQPGV